MPLHGMSFRRRLYIASRAGERGHSLDSIVFHPSPAAGNGGRRRRRGAAGGGDGGGAGGVRRRQHPVQAGGVRRHGHAHPRRLPLPLRLRRPRPARLPRREEEENETDVESGGAVLHLRPLRGVAGAEPVHLRDEADVGHLRVRHDEPHPGHDLPAGPPLPVREAGHPQRLRPGQARRHRARRRRRHAAHLLQGRPDHALAQPPRPRRRHHPPPRRPPAGLRRRRRRRRKPCDGVGAGDEQLLLLRGVADRAGEAEPGVPVPLLQHGAHVRDEHAAVAGLRALLPTRRRAVAPRLRHQAPRRRLLGRVGVGRDAGGAVVVREAAGASVRVGVQPADGGGGGRAELAAAGGAAAPRHPARGGAHRPRPLRRPLGQRPRDRPSPAAAQAPRPPRALAHPRRPRPPIAAAGQPEPHQMNTTPRA